MTPPRLSPPVSERDHVQGNPEAPLTLVEYGDYECPYCGRAHAIVQEVRRRLGARLRFVFRNFPLTQIHPRAQHAAEAAEAAGAQGRFWEMHDWLFQHQRTLEDGDLTAGAKHLGLDADRVRRELDEGVHEPRVREDFAGGVRSGVNGTPTFFVNGRRHDEAWDLETLLETLDAEVAPH